MTRIKRTGFVGALAGVFSVAALSLTSLPAAAEGYVTHANALPHLERKETRQARSEQTADRGERRELSGWARAVFFQGKDPNDAKAVKELARHPGAAGM